MTAASTASNGTSGHRRTARPTGPDGEKPRRSTMANSSKLLRRRCPVRTHAIAEPVMTTSAPAVTTTAAVTLTLDTPTSVGFGR